MGKLNLVILFLISSIIQGSTTLSKKPEPVEKWFKDLHKQSLPKNDIIEFYIHEVLGGPGQTAWPIAQANITATSPTNFGTLILTDDLVTIGMSPNSTKIGRSQGFHGFADLNQLAIYLSLNFVFTGGEYNGSTISILGRNTITNVQREVSIVGGTGVFRLARGVATATTYPEQPGTAKYTMYVTYD